jgi:hypothetical protein
MNRQPNVVQAGSGNGMDVLGGLLNTWARKKDIDYRWSRDNQLLEKQHELGMERDTHKAMQSTIANGASAVINSHFDNLLETNRSANKMEQIGETGNQTRLNIKEGGAQDRRTIGHKAKKDSALKTQVHGQNTEMERLKAGNEIGRMADENLYRESLEDKQSGNKIKLEREKGKQTRNTEKSSVKTGIQGMRDLSSGLAENYEDPSTGISPLVANSGSLQNIGNSLRDHPYMKANPKTSTAAPMAPKTGSNTGGDDSGSATVTAPKVKKPRAPRVKKTGTYDDSYGGA